MTTPNLKIEYLPTRRLIPYAKNAKVHSTTQVEDIANSIREFGFNNPVLVDERDGIVAGHGRVMAAELLGLDAVPCIRLSHLSERQRRAYILADNKLAEKSTWDFAILAEEVNALAELDVDLELTGFDEQELDALLKLDEDLLPSNFGGETIEVSGHKRVIGAQKPEAPQVFRIEVTLKSEEERSALYSDLTANGYECRLRN